MNETPVAGISYVLPLKSSTPLTTPEFSAYLRWLAPRVTEVIVVDASPDDAFTANHRSWASIVSHIRPATDLLTPMGKVGNVLTGLRVARSESVIIADDDVRYDERSLAQISAALNEADVVRPQNYFDPLPWHARWDTGRMLLNRMTGGDWPGTIGVQLSYLRATGGYDGRALFENLELVRTVVAAGGKERALLGTYVLRRPSTARHFWSQRIRQAYDEMARPARLISQLAVLPIAVALMLAGKWYAMAVAGIAIVIVAELGRWRAGGRRVFPFTASLLAPVWIAERAVCSWLALFARIVLGGVPYRGTILRHAATPLGELRTRYQKTRIESVTPPDRTARYQSA
jgi:hypothetical protein